MRLEGFLLKLEEDSWNKIDKKARNAIRKAKKYLQIRVGDLDELAAMHSNRIYLPRRLSSNQLIFTATLDSQPVASILVTTRPKQGKIIYRYAGSDKRYNSYNGNSLLLWHMVKVFGDQYEYLDLGGSTKDGRRAFKRQFATETYFYQRKKPFLARSKFRLSKYLPYRIHRTFSPGGRVDRLIQKIIPHNVSKQDESNRIIHVSCDDLSHSTERASLKRFMEMRESYPEFRVTFFTIPKDIGKSELATALLKEEWVDLGLHGYMHSKGELWDKLSSSRIEHLLRAGLDEFRANGLSASVFKSPSYRSTDSLPHILKKIGLKYVLLSNDQFKPLTNNSIKPLSREGLVYFPTNYSGWFRDTRRLDIILDNNGYLSIQTHVADKRDALAWILDRVETIGGYTFEKRFKKERGLQKSQVHFEERPNENARESIDK